MDTKGKILVVDDDEGICTTMQGILEMEGYEACVAYNGYDALEAARREAFDLVLMDIKMPGIDGVETFKRLKEFASMPVIMISAYAVGDLIAEAIREGAFSVMQKPIDIDMLLGTIESLRTKGAFVLLVDDDVNTCEMLTEVLIANNYDVAVVHDGAAAVEQVKAKNFDVIVLDMKLPVLNGLEAYLGIRECRPDAIVIVVTAYPLEMDGIANQAVEKGAHLYLQKPFSIDVLLDAIAKIKKA